jgi:cytochrome c peroxidase
MHLQSTPPASLVRSFLGALRSGRVSWAAAVILVIGTIAAQGIPIGIGKTPPATDRGAGPITPIPEPPPLNPRKVALGGSLFGDPRLSGNGQRACVSCHAVDTNGADSRARDVAPDGALMRFNTPTVFNAALRFRLNWEGDAATLEDEAKASLKSPSIMGGNLPRSLSALRNDPKTNRQFQEAYGHGPDEASLLNAIATYERSLLTPGSRFDRWLRGDDEALSPEEQQGYQLFKVEGCASCHQGVNVGGNLFERSGIFHPLTGDGAPLLRVPSLRNVAVTAPYFHDGSAATLQDAVRRMARAQLGITPTRIQVDEITAFLRTLTGTYHGKPLSAPDP